jgi:hypothetical protein
MKSDHKYFNCSEEHESYYVSELYDNKQKVHDFLEKSCKNGDINNSTHDEVYKLIEEKLGLIRWKYFNCSKEHELNHVSGLYNKKQWVRVYKFLKENCENGKINNLTRKEEVYKLIEEELGLIRE